MGIAQNTREVPLAQRLAVARENRKRLFAHALARHCIVAGDERRHGVLHQGERFVAGETDACCPDGRIGCMMRMGDARSRRGLRLAVRTRLTLVTRFATTLR